MTRSRRGVSAVCALAAALGLLVCAARARPVTLPPPGGGVCTVAGPRWERYDAHGGSHPKLVATGNRYAIQRINVTCARAQAWLRRIFPLMPRPPYKPAVLRGGPRGFTCRTGGGGPPDKLYNGICTKGSGARDGQLFQWAPV